MLKIYCSKSNLGIIVVGDELKIILRLFGKMLKPYIHNKYIDLGVCATIFLLVFESVGAEFC